MPSSPPPSRSLPPSLLSLPLPRHPAVKPQLSARCQESSEHGAQRRGAAGCCEQAQALLSLSLPARSQQGQAASSSGETPHRGQGVGVGEPPQLGAAAPSPGSVSVLWVWPLACVWGWGVLWVCCGEGEPKPPCSPGRILAHSCGARTCPAVGNCPQLRLQPRAVSSFLSGEALTKCPPLQRGHRAAPALPGDPASAGSNGRVRTHSRGTGRGRRGGGKEGGEQLPPPAPCRPPACPGGVWCGAGLLLQDTVSWAWTVPSPEPPLCPPSRAAPTSLSDTEQGRRDFCSGGARRRH